MRLECDSGKSYNDPTPAVIKEVVSKLGQPGTEFVILVRKARYYMQATADEEGRCEMQYREGSEDQAFRCTNGALRIQDVVAAMKEYAAGSNAWKSRLKWAPLSEEDSVGANGGPGGKSEKSGCYSVVLAVAAFVAVILFWLV